MTAWEEFCNWLNGITNNQTFVAFVSFLSALASVLVVISRTSFGRKALNKLTELSNFDRAKIDEFAHQLENKSKEIAEFIENKQKELEKFETELMNKATIIYNQFDAFEVAIFKIIGEIPNAKVQTQLVEFKEEWKDEKKKIAETMGKSYTEFEEKFESVMAEINAIKEGLNNGQREETIDNQREEETL